jgi:hypothetical protein
MHILIVGNDFAIFHGDPLLPVLCEQFLAIAGNPNMIVGELFENTAGLGLQNDLWL